MSVGAILVVVGLIPFAIANTGEAQASSDASSETIASLSEKVRKLSFEVSLLNRSVTSLKTGLPGLYLSPQQTYGRLFAVETKLGNICRDKQLVSSISQGYGGQVTAAYVRC